jgi:hypothetical protein
MFFPLLAKEMFYTSQLFPSVWGPGKYFPPAKEMFPSEWGKQLEQQKQLETRFLPRTFLQAKKGKKSGATGPLTIDLLLA